jgi:hypothetical protein
MFFFPLILSFFAQYKPLAYPRTLFTSCSSIIVKKFVWIGLHESDTLLSQNLFHIFKEFPCMVVKEIFSNKSCMHE